MRSKFVTAAIIALSTAMMTEPVAAQTSAAAPAPPSMPAVLPEAQRASIESALAFARVYCPTDLVTTSAVDASRQAFRADAAKRPEAAETEKQYPGITKHIEDAIAGGVQKIYVRELPTAQRGIAEYARQYFTDADMHNLVEFYVSGAGAAAIRAAIPGMDISNVSSMVDENGNANVTGKDIRGLIAKTGFLGRMSSADVSALARFAITPTGRQLQRVSPGLLEEVARQTNQLVTKGQGDIQEAVMLAVHDAMAAKADGKK
jgi:hypothetical protein